MLLHAHSRGHESLGHWKICWLSKIFQLQPLGVDLELQPWEPGTPPLVCLCCCLETGKRTKRKIQAPLHTRSGWPVVPLFKKKMRSLNFIPRGLWFPQKLKVESIGSLPFCREICDWAERTRINLFPHTTSSDEHFQMRSSISEGTHLACLKTQEALDFSLSQKVSSHQITENLLTLFIFLCLVRV